MVIVFFNAEIVLFSHFHFKNSKFLAVFYFWTSIWFIHLCIFLVLENFIKTCEKLFFGFIYPSIIEALLGGGGIPMLFIFPKIQLIIP